MEKIQIMGWEMSEGYDSLKLENQLCFPLYVCAKEVVRRYKPALDPIGLTYTQFITMMALWEHRQVNVKKLGDLLYLDSGTLTPVLKKLEQKGYVQRKRSPEDERNLLITITEKGEQLRQEALKAPDSMSKCIHLTDEESAELYRLLHKMMDTMTDPD